MKLRCYYPNAKGYKYYGGKGVIICEEWLNDKIKFFNWALNNGYENNLSIDRIESDKDYEPNNCRWITMAEQQNNRTNNVFIEFNGETKTIPQWSRETGISPHLIKNRFENGECDLFREPEEFSIEVLIEGEYKSLYELSNISGIPYLVIYQRYRAGWESEKLISKLETKEIKHIEINGETHTVTEWAEISGLHRNVILNRIKQGLEGKLLIQPIKERNKKYIEIEGEYHTIDEWCEIADITYMTFNRRFKKGLRGKELITQPYKKDRNYKITY